MKRRLYFLLPDVDSASSVVNELLLARVSDRQIHVLANEKVDLANLPRATIWQRSDIIHGLEIGLIFGGLSGALFGGLLTMVSTSSIGPVGLILATTIGGTVIGTWSSGMVAASLRNTRLKNFERSLADGQILLMVDVAKEQVLEVQRMIESHHPKAHAEGTEPTIPAFP